MTEMDSHNPERDVVVLKNNKRSRITIQWADESFSLGSFPGFGIQPSNSENSSNDEEFSNSQYNVNNCSETKTTNIKEEIEYDDTYKTNGEGNDNFRYYATESCQEQNEINTNRFGSIQNKVYIDLKDTSTSSIKTEEQPEDKQTYTLDGDGTDSYEQTTTDFCRFGVHNEADVEKTIDNQNKVNSNLDLTAIKIKEEMEHREFDTTIRERIDSYDDHYTTELYKTSHYTEKDSENQLPFHVERLSTDIPVFATVSGNIKRIQTTDDAEEDNETNENDVADDITDDYCSIKQEPSDNWTHVNERRLTGENLHKNFENCNKQGSSNYPELPIDVKDIKKESEDAEFEKFHLDSRLQSETSTYMCYENQSSSSGDTYEDGRFTLLQEHPACTDILSKKSNRETFNSSLDEADDAMTKFEPPTSEKRGKSETILVMPLGYDVDSENDSSNANPLNDKTQISDEKRNVFDSDSKNIDNNCEMEKSESSGMSVENVGNTSNFYSNIEQDMKSLRFYCKYCDMRFKTRSDCRVHKASHDGRRVITCNVCHKKFTSNWEFQTHYVIHGDNRNYTCHYCGKGFRRPSNLKEHVRIHTGDYPYKCQLCGQGFHSRPRYQSHMVKHEQERFDEKTIEPQRLYKCNTCGESDMNKNEFKYHKLMHERQKSLDSKEKSESSKTKDCKSVKCNICLLEFQDEEKFQLHMVSHIENSVLNKHDKKSNEAEDVVDDKTENCDTVIDTGVTEKLDNPTDEEIGQLVQQSLLKNSASEESSVKAVSCFQSYTCRLCNETFDRVTSYRIHKMKHRGEVPYECQECHKLFSCQSDLARHNATHSDAKPYQCDECGRMFKRRSNLMEHKITHMKDAPLPRRSGFPPQLAKQISNLPSSATTNQDVPFIDSNVDAPTSSGKYKCRDCWMTFKSRRELSVHRFYHNGGQLSYCEYCNKEFVYKSDMSRHLISHTGEKPFPCHLCTMKFARKADLLKHIAKHSQKNSDRMKLYPDDENKHSTPKSTNISDGENYSNVSVDKIEIYIDDDNDDGDNKRGNEESAGNGPELTLAEADKMETSYDETGAMFLFVANDLS